MPIQETVGHHMPNPYTKFEVSSLSRSGDISWGVKFETSHVTLNTPLSEMIFHRQGGTGYAQPTD